MLNSGLSDNNNIQYLLYEKTDIFMKKSIFVTLISIGIWSAGCSKISNSNTSYTPSCTGAVKSYKTDVAPIVSQYCAGCHLNLSTYSGLAANRSNVSGQIESGNMPRGASLSTAQKDAVICWISSGAPNN
jgi:hypothetical protein